MGTLERTEFSKTEQKNFSKIREMGNVYEGERLHLRHRLIE